MGFYYLMMIMMACIVVYVRVSLALAEGKQKGPNHQAPNMTKPFLLDLAAFVERRKEE